LCVTKLMTPFGAGDTVFDTVGNAVPKHLHGVPAAIYGAEPSAEARTQGGQLDIHVHDGQVALEAAGVTAQFREIIRQGGEASRVLDQHGTVLIVDLSTGAAR